MTKDQFLIHCAQVAALVEKKRHDYQGSLFALEDYFPMGARSYAQMVYTKALRIVSVVDRQDHEPNFESLEDSAKDLLAYTVFLLDYLYNRKIPAVRPFLDSQGGITRGGVNRIDEDPANRWVP